MSNSLLIELLAVFREDTASRLRRLRSTILSGDYPEMRKEAHSIKGSARQIGATAVANMAFHLETAPAGSCISIESIDQLESELEKTCDAIAHFCSEAG